MLQTQYWVAGELLLLAGIYIGWIAIFRTLTGLNRLEDSLGILLGLFIAAYPVANGLDLLHFMRSEQREAISTTLAGLFRLGLNALALLIGWVVIFVGQCILWLG